MWLQIDISNGIPIYRQLIDQVRRQILTGRLPSGTRLSSVREVAAELQVNPMTVSKAYAQLEREGLVERQRGIGLFVRDLPASRHCRDAHAELARDLQKVVIAALQLGIPEEQVIRQLHATFDEFGDASDNREY